jgi:predicted acyltransferase
MTNSVEISDAASPPSPLAHQRLLSIDAYRGLVMLLMMAEVLRLKDVQAKLIEGTTARRIFDFLAFHQSHVAWAGCSLHDLIQPSFSFLVGVALPFSLAARLAKGQSFRWMTWHAAWRALVLTGLGIFLRSIGKSQTNFTFEDTLTQIGLGYLPLFLLGFFRPRWQVLALVVVLLGYWGLFAAYPLPPANFDYAEVNADTNDNYTGFAAHWNKNSNAAWAFDRWFLNLFPRESTFEFNRGGYTTLSFIPTLGTMILGSLCGGILRRAETDNQAALANLPYGGPIATSKAILWMLAAGLLCAVIAVAIDRFGLCPIVKRIWTPTWTLYSGGWCFGLMAAFYFLVDVPRWSQRSLPGILVFPLVVVGANSIAAYMLAHLIEHFTVNAIHTHLGADIFRVLGEAYVPLIEGLLVLFIYWLILLWMYQRKLFLKL